MASGSRWNLLVWLAGGGCGWNKWVWVVGVVVRKYIDLLILLIPIPLVYVLFLQLHSCFCFFLKIIFLSQFFHFMFMGTSGTRTYDKYRESDG